MVVDSRLFHDPVCDVPNADFSIDWEIPVIYWTVPNVMVTFTVPHEIAPIFPQNPANTFFIFCHYAITAWVSILNIR